MYAAEKGSKAMVEVLLEAKASTACRVSDRWCSGLPLTLSPVKKAVIQIRESALHCVS